jgi:hypothetical protein
MVVNITGLEDSNTWVDIYASVNTISDGVFGMAMLFGIWFLLLVLFKKFDTMAAMYSASVITSILALLMFYMGWVGESGPTVFIVASCIFTFLLIAKNS